MTTRSFPFVSAQVQTSEIIGEVYEVDDVTLVYLDHLEGHPGWYERKEVPVINELGEEFTAWLYFNERECGPEAVPDGDWARWVQRKRAAACRTV